MLDEIKKTYKENADVIDGWSSLSINELCFKYIECDDELKNNYLSAIIYKCWNIATKAFYAQSIKLASPEDCYCWLVDSIQYVLEHKVWTDKNHPLYNDPKAPEKAINVVFNSTKINFFVALTRQKRKADSTSLSLDALSAEVSDSYFVPVNDKYSVLESDFTSVIRSLYSNYQYFNAICLDLIVNEDVVDKISTDNIKYKKLKAKLKSLDDKYVTLFSIKYNVPKKDIERTLTYIKSMSAVMLQYKIDSFLNQLRHDTDFLDLLN